jgi:hypothetical protein
VCSARSRPRLGYLVLAGLLFGLLPLTASPALASEIFVPPAVSAAGNTAGQNYPVLNGTTTHFAFGIPDDMSGFVAARVVLIPAATGNVSYSMTLSLAQDTEQNFAHFFGQGTTIAAVTQNLISEIDVSALFTSAFNSNGVNSGLD